MQKKLIILYYFSFFLLGILGCCDNNQIQETESRLKIIDINLTNEEYAFAISKKDTKLKEDLDKFIITLKKSGNFDSIVSIYMEHENDGLKTGVKITSEEVENTDKNLIVVTNCPFEPFEYINNDGLMYGIDIEIANAYAKSKGLELIVKNIDFDDILKEVSSGKADIGMAGITVTDERKKICNFTESYFKSSQKLIVDGKNKDFDKCKTSEDVIKIIKSLSNESIGYQIRTTGNWFIVGDGTDRNLGFVNIKPKGFNTPNDSIKELLEGKIYAAILDDEPAKAFVEEINLKDSQEEKNLDKESLKRD